jgi:hypothetical protein
MQLRVAHGLPLASFQGRLHAGSGPPRRCGRVGHPRRHEAGGGGGSQFGLGGILTIVPDLGILSAITMRTIQKLSLIYGFELNTDDEIAELWIAAASAAGVDISRELLEKGSGQSLRAARDPADCGQGRRRGGGKVGRTPDSDYQLRYRMRPELLLREGVGRTGADAFPRQASRSSAQVCRGTSAITGRGFGDAAVVTRSRTRGCERDCSDKPIQNHRFKAFHPLKD